MVMLYTIGDGWIQTRILLVSSATGLAAPVEWSIVKTHSLRSTEEDSVNLQY